MKHVGSPPNFEGHEDNDAETIELEQELYTAHDETKRLKSEIAKLQKQMTRRQKEIAAWQKRYDTMSKTKKVDIRVEFEEAVHWRTQEIALIQAELGALEAQAAIAQESIQGVARHLEPRGVSTGPRTRRRIGLGLSQRQREIRARARTTYLGRRLHTLRVELEAERAQGPPVEADLETAANEAAKQVERIAAAVGQTKEQIKRRKRELNEWKQWYSNVPDIDKSAEKSTLDREINWRAHEIQTLQIRIGALEAEKLEAMGKLEQARIQIEALQAGAYEGPIEDDPRLAHLKAVRDNAAATLDMTRRSAKHPRRTKTSAKPRKRKARGTQRHKPANKRSGKK